MFLTLQFPLFDYRFLKTDTNRTERPNWPTPGNNDRVRYFGEIFDRNKPYLGPWDDEKKYCNARTVINLCGMEEEHFYKNLFTHTYQSRILFRRFQSDGKCMAKFEIGLNDNLEKDLAAKNPDAGSAAAAIHEQIQKYLQCPVRIKIGNRLNPFVPLADAGKDLKSAYYWATSKGKKTFDPKDIHYETDNAEPVLLIQLNTERLDTSALDMQKVDIPGITDAVLQLYSTYITYRIGNRNYNIKTWIICQHGNKSSLPLRPADFDKYNDTIRYLRINLLRIHMEIILQNKLVESFAGANNNFKITDTTTRDRLYFYLHKIWLNLSAIKRNKQPQQQLLETVFNLNEKYYGSAGMDEQMAVLEDYQQWLKNLELSPSNEQVKTYIDNNSTSLQNKKDIAASETTVFISYNHADEDTAGLLKRKLEKENIKVILDSASMLAGTKIDDFIISSIKNSGSTISIVSVNSLTSGWVSIETVNTLSFKDFFPDKKFIPCYLDKEFFDKGFVLKATEIIDKKLAEIEELSKKYFEKKLSTVDLDDEKRMLNDLRAKLSAIVQHLKQVLCIDMRPEKIETNFQALVDAIKN